MQVVDVPRLCFALLQAPLILAARSLCSSSLCFERRSLAPLFRAFAGKIADAGSGDSESEGGGDRERRERREHEGERQGAREHEGVTDGGRERARERQGGRKGKGGARGRGRDVRSFG